MRKTLFAALAATALLGAFSPATAAMTDDQCSTTWKQADKNNDGALTQDEAPSYFAAARVAGKTVGDKMAPADFIALCKDGSFEARVNAPGAPQKGANSFTENQARDRAAARGFTDVSKLTKDQDGIWRGTAKQSGKDVQIAIDFKGDVVAGSK